MLSQSKILKFEERPTVWDIEAKSNAVAALDPHVPIELQLPRNTSSNLLVDTSFVALLATLVRRPGKLVIRDSNSSWGAPKTVTRFLSEIDGITALYFSDAAENCELANLPNQFAPASLAEGLYARLIRSALVRETGAVRTYIAIDPTFSVPLELAMDAGRLVFLRRYIAQLPIQFGERANKRSFAQMTSLDNIIYSLVFEIFQNTYEHGRFDERGHLLPGLRYIVFRRHNVNTNNSLGQRSEGFDELQRYFFGSQNAKRFLEVSIGDCGLGILDHFRQAHASSIKTLNLEDFELLNQILASSLTSKQVRGAGRGLPIALSSLRKLGAFVSLRTGKHWLFSDFSGNKIQSKIKRSEAESFGLTRVKTIAPISAIAGTHFSFFMEF